ncbi:MAG TPA: TonB-dependent receptor, partial [Moraxellaceae bacterium]
AISGNQLQDEGVGRAANDVIKYVPNASAATSGGHTRPRWWIRGVGTGTQTLDSPSPIGIYLDDVYISNASATGFPVFDLERVEVLRGPQGTLWGKNTTGGAVNYVSKKPSLTSSDGYAKIDYGSFDSTVLEAAFGGPNSERVATRAAFHYETRDGAYDNTFTGDKGVALKDGAARVQFLAKVTDNLEALFNVHLREYSSTGNNATVIGTGAGGSYNINGVSYLPSKDRYTTSSNAPGATDISQSGAALNLKWQLNRYELTSISAFEGFEQETLTDSDNTPLELSRGHSEAKSHQISQEFRLASPREDRLNWVTGLHYFKEDIRSDSASATLDTLQRPGPRPLAYSDAFYTYGSESYAAFGSATFRFTPQLAVTGGLRWTTENKDIDLTRYLGTGTVAFADSNVWWPLYAVSSPKTVTARQDREDSWGDWSYDLTPEYSITDTQRVYFHFAKGFRGGGYNSGATTQVQVNVLSPEYLTSYELGYKSEWLDGRLNLNANVFHYIYEDMQINAVVPTTSGPSSQLRNAAEGEANGAELEIVALPVSNLRIRGGLGWLDTEFTNFRDSAGNYTGNKFVRSPDFSAVANVEYRIPLASGDDIVLGTDWNYVTRFYFYTNDQVNPNLSQGPYALGNARVAYVTSDNKFNVTAYVNNLTDKQYKQHTLPGTTGGTGTIVYWGEGLSGGVSVTTRW